MMDAKKPTSAFLSYFKIFIVLLAIALVSGVLLAVCSDLLFISDAERTERGLKKIYPQATSFTDITPEGGYKYEAFGEIMSVFQADDGTYIVLSKGLSGYKGRSEVFIAVSTEGILTNIIISSYGGDDKTTSINKKYLDNSYVGKNLNTIGYFHVDKGGSPVAEGNVDVTSGATSRATMYSVCSAVNMSIYYLKDIGVIGIGIGEVVPVFSTYYNNTKFVSLDINESFNSTTGSIIALAKTENDEYGFNVIANGGETMVHGGVIGNFNLVIILDKNGIIKQLVVLEQGATAPSFNFTSESMYLNKNINSVSKYIRSGATYSHNVVFEGIEVVKAYYNQFIVGGGA